MHWVKKDSDSYNPQPTQLQWIHSMHSFIHFIELIVEAIEFHSIIQTTHSIAFIRWLNFFSFIQLMKWNDENCGSYNPLQSIDWVIPFHYILQSNDGVETNWLQIL